jgi:hypothetical protein
MNHRQRIVLSAMTALSVLSGFAWADDRHDARRPDGLRREAPHHDVIELRPGPIRLDQRYHHDRYYPARGYAMPALPNGAISVAFGREHFFFHSGVWLRPFGASFQVVLPPIGIQVPILPQDCVTIWIGGSRYFYANGVYYAGAPNAGYVVVAPPAEADSAQTTPPPQAVKPPPVPVIYPRNGQSAAQTEADRQDCNRWATTQPAAMADGEVFQRAVAACMDARGYTVR